jgi:hypothetical protein
MYLVEGDVDEALAFIRIDKESRRETRCADHGIMNWARFYNGENESRFTLHADLSGLAISCEESYLRIKVNKKKEVGTAWQIVKGVFVSTFDAAPRLNDPDYEASPEFDYGRDCDTLTYSFNDLASCFGRKYFIARDKQLWISVTLMKIVSQPELFQQYFGGIASAEMVVVTYDAKHEY